MHTDPTQLVNQQRFPPRPPQQTKFLIIGAFCPVRSLQDPATQIHLDQSDSVFCQRCRITSSLAENHDSAFLTLSCTVYNVQKDCYIYCWIFPIFLYYLFFFFFIFLFLFSFFSFSFSFSVLVCLLPSRSGNHRRELHGSPGQWLPAVPAG